MRLLRGVGVSTFGAAGRAVARQFAHTSRRSARRIIPLLLIFAFLATAIASFLPSAPRVLAETSTDLHPFAVRLAPSNSGTLANAPPSELIAHAREQRMSQLTDAVDKLVKLGQAGHYTADRNGGVLHVALTDQGRQELLSNQIVASIDPDTTTAPNTSFADLKVPSRTTQGTCNISSINFIQAYSPFMWGKADVGGLSVTLTLEDGHQNIIGVAVQTTQPQPNNVVPIDSATLYYDTVFVDPNNPSHPVVMIAPGDQVHVVLSGVDPSPSCGGQQTTDDRRITVDNIQAYTSYMRNTVWGTTSPNSTIYVTVATDYLDLDHYLAPANNVTYAQTTSDASGNFSVSKFLVGSSTTPQVITLGPGTTGYVRVQHSTNDEVYTVHGQKVFALENSSVAHGFMFALPTAPYKVTWGVPVTRPVFSGTATLLNSSNVPLDTIPFQGSPNWSVIFSQMISAGDSVQVSIANGPTTTVTTSPLSGTVDLAGNQVTGTGPANTPVVAAVGLTDGWISRNFTFTYQQIPLTTSGNGTFSTGGFSCGSTKLRLQPGSFGYVGYEDAHANFIYTNFAAPRTDVMENFPFVEGFVANGTVTPSITLADSTGAQKAQTTAPPVLLYLIEQRLFVNVYFNATLSQFVNPGDSVTVVENGQTSLIPVDNLSASVNTENNTIVGAAPSGTQINVIPAQIKAASQLVKVDSSGNFATGNPFTLFYSASCLSVTQSMIFHPGDWGRAYLSHADGNTVFLVWGRSMRVAEDENFVELFMYPYDGLDWYINPPQTTGTVSLTNAGFPTYTGTGLSDYSLAAYAKIPITDNLGDPIAIRGNASVTATFPEGPPGGPTRTATISVASTPLIIAAPDPVSDSIGGIGPTNWIGSANLNYPVSSSVIPIPIRNYVAFGPSTFVDSQGSPVPIASGYSGLVSFTSGQIQTWVAWAVTATPVRITNFLRPGSTQVCGTGPANSTIHIHDVSNEPEDMIIATGSSDAKGNFCVAVPSLVKGQVIMAESNSIYSEAVVVGINNPIYLPVIFR